MDEQPPRDLEALHALLSERLAALSSRRVAAIVRAVLEVSSLPCVEALWSIEFAFDEDDGRVARVEVRFAEGAAEDPFGGLLRGYAVHVLLPRVLPPRAPGEGAEPGLAMTVERGSLVARFVRELDELGAYRAIEDVEAVAVDVELI